jgi:hypothetical protein
MMIYILMVLNLAGPQPAQPVATTAFSDPELCIRQSGAFNALASTRAWSWCVQKTPDGKVTPLVVTPRSPTPGQSPLPPER